MDPATDQKVGGSSPSAPPSALTVPGKRAIALVQRSWLRRLTDRLRELARVLHGPSRAQELASDIGVSGAFNRKTVRWLNNRGPVRWISSRGPGQEHRSARHPVHEAWHPTWRVEDLTMVERLNVRDSFTNVSVRGAPTR